MQGDKIYEATGRTTGTRVLPGDDYRYVKMEISFEESGTVLEMPATNVGTYTVFERVPGQLYGEGRGIVMTSDGEGAIWNGHGVGRMTGDGMAMSFRYSLAFQARGEGKLARLNNVLAIGEYETDSEGKHTDALWEWR